MAETHTGSRSVVTHPAGVSVRLLDPGNPRGLTRDTSPPLRPLDPLLGPLEGAGLRLHDAVELEVPFTAAGIRGDVSGPLEIAVDVGVADGAVVLLEQDGAYRWTLPVASGGAFEVRAPGLIRFRIEPPAPAPPPSTLVQRSPLADAVMGWVGGKIRAYVLRYVAGVAAEVLAARIDGGGPEQLVGVAGPSWDAWTPLTAPPKVAAGRRILLLVHGTFSSTGGSFAGLRASSAGSALVGVLGLRYDAVLGFDHHTLTRDPDENARALLAALTALNLPAGTQFDAVAHSRGGLVLRVLVEELLPQAGWPLQPGRLVFVGCTNGGTALAAPANWKRLIDVYTNIVLAGTRALGFVPGLGPASAALGQAMESLGRFIQYLAEAAIDQRRVPGLAAMMPESALVRRLNAGRPSLDHDISYYAAAATFAPHEGSPGFTAGLCRAAADWLADALFSTDNDLVVGTPAMTAFGLHAPRLRGQHAFAATDGIYHTIYFGAAKLIDWLGDWLLDQPGLAGRLIHDVVVLEADSSANDAVGRIAPLPIETPVIFQRTFNNQLFCYVQSAGQALSQLRPVVAAAQLEIRSGLLRPAGSDPFAAQDAMAQSAAPLPSATPGALGPTLTSALDLHEGGAAQIFAPESILNRYGQELLLQRYEAVLPKLADEPYASGVVLGMDGTMAALLDAGWANALKNSASLGQVASVGGHGTRDGPVQAEGPDESLFMSIRTGAVSGGGRSHSGGTGEPYGHGAHGRGSRSHAAPFYDPGTSAPPPDAYPAPVRESQIECYFEAEMPPHPPLDSPATVTVKLSAEAPVPISEATRKTASAQADSTLPITITAMARRNCSIQGAKSIDVPAPSPGQPFTVSFRLLGKAQGEAELWIEAFQADRRMVVLALTPLFLDTNSRLSVASVGATARVEGALIDLRIRDLHRNDGDTVRLEYSIQSEELEILREEESVEHPDKNRLQFIRSIYDDVAGCWRTASLAASADPAAFLRSFGDDLRSSGGALCDALVPENIRRILFDAWQRQNIGAVRVLTREPSIPWELLFLHEPGGSKKNGCFFAELGLVRWNPVQGYPPTRLRIRPGHSFYLIPNYPARYELAGAAEDRSLVERLFAAQAVDSTLAGVRSFLDDAEFDLLHVACHGEAVRDRPWDSGVLLSDPDPAGHLTILKAVRVEQAETQRSRPLVFLNACQVGMSEHGLVGAGGMAQAFLSGVQAGAVVAPMWSVLDATASHFAVEFFEQLSAGATLAQAAHQARAVAKGAGDPSWLAYSVWGHPYARLEIEPAAA